MGNDMERLNPRGDLPHKIHLACLSDPRHQLRDMFGRCFGKDAVSEIKYKTPICEILQNRINCRVKLTPACDQYLRVEKNVYFRF